jgi:DNA-binding response OmpR family regulator
MNDYDVIVLDRDLPVLHGDDVCGRLIASVQARILMLTAVGTIEDRVAGLGRGADDYLPKPFAFAELVARLRATCGSSPT